MPETSIVFRSQTGSEDFADHEDRSLGNHAPLYAEKNGVVLVRDILLNKECYKWKPAGKYDDDVLSLYAKDELNSFVKDEWRKITDIADDVSRVADGISNVAGGIYDGIKSFGNDVIDAVKR
jgi:hypothetical protein